VKQSSNLNSTLAQVSWSREFEAKKDNYLEISTASVIFMN